MCGIYHNINTITQVRIGRRNLSYKVGYIHYWTNLWGESSSLCVCVMAGVSLIILAAVATALVCYRRRRRHFKARNAKSSYDDYSVAGKSIRYVGGTESSIKDC